MSVQAQILNLLADLKRDLKVSYLLISHDLEAVYYLADQIYIMFRGQIMEVVEDIRTFHSISHPYARRLLSLDGVYEEPDLSDDRKDEHLPGCAYAPFCPLAEDSCSKERPKLTQREEGRSTACLKQ